MNLKEFKELINSIPDELNDYEIIYSECLESDSVNKTMRKNVKLESIAIDTATNELVISTKKSINNIIKSIKSER